MSEKEGKGRRLREKESGGDEGGERKRGRDPRICLATIPQVMLTLLVQGHCSEQWMQDQTAVSFPCTWAARTLLLCSFYFQIDLKLSLFKKKL